MPYYKLPHTDGVVMWFERGRPDLKLAEAPGVEEPKLPSKPKPKPKPRKAKSKGDIETT